MSERYFVRDTSRNLPAIASLTLDYDFFADGLPDVFDTLRGAPGIQNLLTLSDIEELLTRRALRRPAVRLIYDGRQLADSQYVRDSSISPGAIDGSRVARVLHRGGTLVLQGLQESVPRIGRLARGLQRDLGHPIHVNAYVTPPQSQGFGAHHDVQDSFIVQTVGTKTWYLHEPIIGKPFPHETADVFPSPTDFDSDAKEVTLNAGDVMWLPRGWIHYAKTENDISVHLTISADTLTRGWLLTQVVPRNLPAELREGVKDIFSSDDIRADEIEKLRSAALEWWQCAPNVLLEDLVVSAVRRRYSSPPRAPLAEFGDLADEYEVEPGVVYDIFSQVDNASVIRMIDCDVVVPNIEVAVLRQILSSKLIRTSDIRKSVDDFSSILRLLHEYGIITPLLGGSDEIGL